MNHSRMIFSPSFRRASRARRGFTLIEIMAVVGIIAVLAAILLPMLAKARRQAQITAMKLNFQMIGTALENYRSDFRNYPTNGFATTDSALNVRTDPSLVMALIGPGPAGYVSASGFTGYTNGDVDGADGPGFRSHFAPVATYATSSAISSGSTSLNFTIPSGNTFPSIGSFTAVGIGGATDPADLHIPIISSTSGAVTLKVPVKGSYGTNTSVALLAPAGRVTNAYLPPERFKVTYVQTTYENTNNLPALPVMLDIWGQPILYFPSYNKYSVNTGNVAYASAAITPILGVPSPNYTNTPVGNSCFWCGPLFNYTTNLPLTGGQVAALLYKLGDHHETLPAPATWPPFSSSTTTNAITTGEIFPVQRPYFLMSSGPDSAFTDLTGLTNASDVQYKMNHSDDVYDFDQ